ncbi:hypothetical protein [Bacillus mycoides]|uniref:hypothetical protein n=1 Tax=Bacillus mycoides TaxID=1405 RepID=UPI001C012096|nr:hypothetical protein [Bacillus mycoides]MCQ6536485.1 hypothetical protein [Bacillus mycoides]QWI09115.1 hypothetical protein EXW47_01090 [Bacillus mycoides]QWI53521.1 hypothetical protein EXW42_04740 [Bacillus mycoides]QWI90152.1 hypothetical protein J5W00_01085 [Bacillus mycoides]
MKRVDNRPFSLLSINTYVFIIALEKQVCRSGLFPATYAANGYYTIIFGGVNLAENIISLLLIILVTQLVVGITIGIKVIVKRGSSVVKEA